MKKISIIIPMWNVEEYIIETLTSIHKQTFTDYEVICVDDGSIDNTFSVCEEYLKKNFSCYKLYHIEHSGVSIARNVALENVSGEYVFFLDSDDMILYPNTLEKLYRLIVDYDCDIVFSRFFNISNSRFSKETYNNGVVSTKQYIKDIFINNRCYNPSLYFCKFSTIKDVRFVEGIYMEDMVYFTDILMKSEKIYFSDIITICKRIRDGAITNSSGKYDFFMCIAIDLILQRLNGIVEEDTFIRYKQEAFKFLNNNRRMVSKEYLKKYDECFEEFKNKYDLTY